MVVAQRQAGRRNPAGDRLGESLETQVPGSQRSWCTAEPFRALPLCLPPPSGLSYPQGEAQSGTECSWTFRVLGRLMSRQGAQVAERSSSLLASGGWLGKSHLSLTSLHPGSLIYSTSETKQKQTDLNAYRKTHINPLTSEALNLEPKFAQTQAP